MLFPLNNNNIARFPTHAFAACGFAFSLDRPAIWEASSCAICVSAIGSGGKIEKLPSWPMLVRKCFMLATRSLAVNVRHMSGSQRATIDVTKASKTRCCTFWCGFFFSYVCCLSDKPKGGTKATKWDVVVYHCVKKGSSHARAFCKVCAGGWRGRRWFLVQQRNASTSYVFALPIEVQKFAFVVIRTASTSRPRSTRFFHRAHNTNQIGFFVTCEVGAFFTRNVVFFYAWTRVSVSCALFLRNTYIQHRSTLLRATRTCMQQATATLYPM